MRALTVVWAFSLVSTVFAGDLTVEPGKGTISAILKDVKSGDTIILKAGQYEDTVRLPAGTTLRGAGADATTLTPSDRIAINCEGPKVLIQDLAIAGTDDTLRGVNTDAPVRIERVRFTKIKEAVALMGAPLSDIVACEFIDCGIGVRAIAESCPTIYGCVFRGGNMGVFAMGGAPYIRHNLFVDQAQDGLRIVTKDMNQPVLRENTFLNAEGAAITIVAGKNAFGIPYIRNSVFLNCASAITMDKPEFPGTITDGLIKSCGDTPIRDKDGKPALGLEAARFITADLAITVSESHKVTVSDESLLKGKGLRLPEASADSKGDLGPVGVDRFGVGMKVDPGATPVRWNEPDMIANAVCEEYQALRILDFPRGNQAMTSGPGGPRDKHTDDKGKSVSFDISRFFGEGSLK